MRSFILLALFLSILCLTRAEAAEPVETSKAAKTARDNEAEAIMRNIKKAYSLYSLVYIQKDQKIQVIKNEGDLEAPQEPIGNQEYIDFQEMKLKGKKGGKDRVLQLGVTYSIIEGKVVETPLFGKPKSAPFNEVLQLLYQLSHADAGK